MIPNHKMLDMVQVCTYATRHVQPPITTPYDVCVLAKSWKRLRPKRHALTLEELINPHRPQDPVWRSLGHVRWFLEAIKLSWSKGGTTGLLQKNLKQGGPWAFSQWGLWPVITMQVKSLVQWGGLVTQ